MPNINDYGLPFTSQDGDRKYSAREWREYFSRLIHNGLIQNAANECQVKPQAVPNKTVYVDTGVVFINGAMRVLEEPVTLTVAENTSGNPRIDRVVARLNEASRTIEFAVLEGIPAGSPVSPMLTRADGVYELGLADITMANGYSTITAAEIADQRWDVSLCGASSVTIGVIPPKGLDAVTVQLEPETQELYDSMDADSALRVNMKMFQGMMFRELVSSNFVSTYTCTNGEVLPPIVFCKNFVVPLGVTVTTHQKNISLIVAIDSVTLNGVIDASGKGGLGGAGVNPGAGIGGNGGGNLHIFTDKMYGTGIIKANGMDATAATSYTTPTGLGIKGDDGILPDDKLATGGWSWNANGQGSQGNTLCTMVWDKFYLLGIFHMLYPKTTGGGGGGGGPVDTSTSTGYKGAQGGAGAGGNGGGGSSYSSGGDQGAGGGGGGGGGIVIIHCNNSIPQISIEAKGGAGKNGAGSVPLNGGGGGGGAIICIAKEVLAVTTVSGGVGGTSAGAGSAGVVVNHLI